MLVREDMKAALDSLQGVEPSIGDRLRLRGVVDQAERYGIPYYPEDDVEDKRRWASVWQRKAIDFAAADAFFRDDQGRTRLSGNDYVAPGGKTHMDTLEQSLEQISADRSFRV
mmetsp:Transcript_24812/g.57830  ORF Transcript_24812/g.57830 Transcript_24812/m.57830 type:complete len:113 (+) Transcript_24812:1-339(+)